MSHIKFIENIQFNSFDKFISSLEDIVIELYKYKINGWNISIVQFQFSKDQKEIIYSLDSLVRHFWFFLQREKMSKRNNKVLVRSTCVSEPSDERKEREPIYLMSCSSKLSNLIWAINRPVKSHCNNIAFKFQLTKLTTFSFFICVEIQLNFKEQWKEIWRKWIGININTMGWNGKRNTKKKMCTNTKRECAVWDT